MSKFTGPLQVEFSSIKNQQIQLLDELIWEMDYLGSNNVITVPAGFVCDGMSIPQFLWWWIPPLGHKSTRASVLHDYMISLWRNSAHKALTRKDCDEQFYLALKASGVSTIVANICYFFVRGFALLRYGE